MRKIQTYYFKLSFLEKRGNYYLTKICDKLKIIIWKTSTDEMIRKIKNTVDRKQTHCSEFLLKMTKLISY